jgi:oligosaccharide repeat unit polymerase
MDAVKQKVNVNAKTFLWYFFTISVGFIFYLICGLELRSLLIISLIFFGISPLIIAIFNKKADALSPSVLLPFTFTLYALGPLNVAGQYSNDIIIYYLFLQLIGLISMRVGLYCSIKSRAKYYQFNYNDPPPKTLILLTAVGLFFLSLISLATYFHAFGGLSGFIKTGYGGQFYLVFKEAPVIGSGFEWGLLASILIIFFGSKRRSKIYLFIGGATFLFFTFILLLTGRRHQFIYPFLFGFVLFHYGHKKISSSFIAVGILLGISIMQYYALARYFLSGGLFYALTQVWPAILNNPSLVAPWVANEFRMPAASLLEVLQFGGPGLLFGRSYIAVLGAPIPFLGRLFNFVSFDVNTWRLANLYPDILAAGGGLGFSPVTEGYINFGLIGIILHMFLYGYIIGKIYFCLLSKPTISYLLLFAGSLPVFMLDGMRVHSASFSYAWMRTYLMPWIIFWLIKIFVSNTAQKAASKEDR